MAASDILSIVAVAIALVSAIWSFYQHFRWHKPLLTVSGRWFHNSSLSASGQKFDHSWVLEVTVVNLGDMDTTVVDRYWEFETLDGQTFEIAGSRADSSSEFLLSLFSRNTRFQSKGSEGFSPTVIPRLAVGNWHIERAVDPLSPEVLKSPIRGRAVVKWINRKRSFSARGEHPNIATSYGPWHDSLPDEFS